jgi:TDG/mug DNA glycosylase family protein
VRRWRPTVVAFVGIHPYRVVSGVKDAGVGLQEPLFGGTHAWVLPNPSGLNAHYLPAALGRLFGELRVWAIAEHGRRRNRRGRSAIASSREEHPARHRRQGN